MKFFALIAVLITSAAFSAEFAQFEANSGFGVKNISSHTSVADWNRYFLTTDKGTIEAVATRTSVSDKCDYLTLRIDTNSKRFYSKSTTQYSMKLPKNTNAKVCDHFISKFDYALRNVSSSNTAQIEVEYTSEGTKSISMTFEGQTTRFPLE